MKLVHKFEQNGIKIVFDGNSGALHVVDDLIYEIIDYYNKFSNEEIVIKLSERYGKEEILEALEELNSLESEGLIFSDDPYEKVNLNRKDESYIKAMCLNIAHDCNLRCKYCFASEGDYHGERCLMTEEVGKAAIDLIIEKSGPRRNLEVDLFGGEPLMNFQVVKSVVNYGKDKAREHNKNIRFTMTTNATLLSDEIIDFINENMVNVVLSIDGRKEVNDNIRVRRDGTGTYDTILPSIKKLVNKRGKDKQYYVRGTFTSENLDFYNDVIELLDDGFKEISIEPVVLPEDNKLALQERYLNVIFEQYDKLALKIIEETRNGRPFKFYHFAIDMDGGPCVYKRVSGCGAGHEYIAVTPEGNIYPCHQFVGNEDFKMGNVYDGSLDEKIISKFKNGHIYNKTECLNCWAKFYCSGGCQANNYNFNGSILKPYALGCEMQRKRLECSLFIKASLSNQTED